MSCIGFLSETHRAAMAASSACGAPLSSFASPPATASKVRRVRALAASGNPTIRESAALSYHAPTEVLEQLAGDEVASVRCCVARNERAPEWVLRALVTDADPRVRGWVAANAATHPDVIATLADDPDAQVRAVVAWAQQWSTRGE